MKKNLRARESFQTLPKKVNDKTETGLVSFSSPIENRLTSNTDLVERSLFSAGKKFPKQNVHFSSRSSFPIAA